MLATAVAPGWRCAWNNDLQGEWLESGVNRGSPGIAFVEGLLARLSGPLLLWAGGRDLQNGAHITTFSLIQPRTRTSCMAIWLVLIR